MTNKNSTPSLRSARKVTLGLVVGVLAIVAIGFLLLSRPSNAPGAQSQTPPKPEGTEPASLYGALLGRWLRTDGDYLLDIRAIDGTGKAQVDYFNPRPIHVARAEASREGESLKLVVVLEDVGYPGSYYTLAWSQPEKRLAGEYYQATLQETFEVIFTRLP
ncbi:MAG: hypothetical protein KJ072_00675 [Verrucomicrobia bacterium]|nr:hypothetical protein [Verrucomicrobiota bacterium]